MRHYRANPADEYTRPRENKFVVQGPYKTEVDHNRRIRRIAQRLRITVALAVEKYRELTGLFRPVKISDAERQAWAAKGYKA